MSSTPPEPPGPPPGPAVPPGYQPGDYVPFKDRTPEHPGAVAGAPTWSDQAQQGWGQQPGQQPGPQPGQPPAYGAQDPYRALYGWDAPDRMHYASWGRRVLGYLFDSFIGTVASVPLIAGYVLLLSGLETTTDVYGQETVSGTGTVGAGTIGLLVVGGVVSIVFNLYNMVFRQGRTGYTFGKTVVGIRLVRLRDMQPVGAGMCFVRQLAHYVDSLACYLGWLWPLWDSRNQTLADKIMSTVVIVQSQEEALAPAS